MTAPTANRLIVIAGGSGSGKTTLAIGLAERHPDWTVVHLDNYQKPIEDVPMRGRWRNWDHPDAIDFPKLIRDLETLRRGEPVTVSVRDQTKQTNFFKREQVTLVPGPTIVLEGYLALWHPGVRALANFSIFLNASHEIRLARRRWKKSTAYVEQVLQPMFHEHLEPTMDHANAILHVDRGSAADTLSMVDRLLQPGS